MFAYGMYAMLSTKLFANDGNISKKLITSGPFKMHRNPFYFSLLATVGPMVAHNIVGAIQSGTPGAYLCAALMAGGSAVMVKGLNDYTRADEEILEKIFGKEYTDYKERTPKFIPNPLLLFRKDDSTTQ